MIFTVDPLDQGAISGMPYAAARALERRGLTVIPLESGTGLSTGLSTGPSSAPTSGGIAGAKRKLKALLKRRLPQRMLEWPSRWRSRGDGLVLREAKLAAQRVQSRIAMVRRERELDRRHVRQRAAGIP